MIMTIIYTVFHTFRYSIADISTGDATMSIKLLNTKIRSESLNFKSQSGRFFFYIYVVDCGKNPESCYS